MRLLDLYCGAGGAAMGYHRAGFEVVGLDIRPQPHFPFPFVQGDALRPPLDLRDFDVIHASPPCQRYSRATAWRGRRSDHPDLLAATRKLLVASGRPYVIESVQEARRLLHFSILLCGSMFGLRVQRHRYFEVPCLPLLLLPDCRHRRDDHSFDHGGKQPESVYRDALGCDWMTVQEARQTIPPAYTEFLGAALMERLRQPQEAHP
jgi:DNA (cytosine-5)-methyltransferase 1